MSSSSRLIITTYHDKAMKADLIKQLAVYTNTFQEGMQNVTRPKKIIIKCFDAEFLCVNLFSSLNLPAKFLSMVSF